jgi:archaemetzincin
LKTLLYLAIAIFFTACNQNHKNDSAKKSNQISSASKKKLVVITIQPFEDIPKENVDYVAHYLKKMYANVIINKPIGFPKNSLNQAKTRHRADSLIRFLSAQTKPGYLTIGLTKGDISANKDKIPDWGVMGLGFCPGNSCIASSFRLKGKNKMEKLFKVAIHELGHTQGLKHCPVNDCLMRDAEGKDHLDEEREFCKKCKEVLIKAGWALN